MARIVKHTYKLSFQVYFSTCNHLSSVSTIALKLNLLGIVVVTRILGIKLYVFMKRGWFVRKSRFAVTKWLMEKKSLIIKMLPIPFSGKLCLKFELEGSVLPENLFSSRGKRGI